MFHVTAALGIIVVLIQHGKGADMGLVLAGVRPIRCLAAAVRATF